MPVQWVYLLVIAVWSSTPLAIKLSNDSLTPLASVSLRMLLAVMAAMLLALAIRPWLGNRQITLFKRQHWPVYAVASISVFPNMAMVYTATHYIPSGLVAIMLGLNPFLTGLFSVPLLGERFLTPARVVALGVALGGLVVVFIEQLSLNDKAYIGVLLMMVSACLFSFSTVWVKRLTRTRDVAPTEQAFGSMLFALPGLLICWRWVMGDWQVEFSSTSLWALGYLVVFGSLIGFVAYYHVLRHMMLSTVSLIPLITPVLAVILGALLAGESISLRTLLGGGCILFALAIYQGHLSPRRWRRVSRV